MKSYSRFQNHLQSELNFVREAGTFKNERLLQSSQNAWIEVGGKKVLNLCANNYLGLADDPGVLQSAHKALNDCY